MVYVDVEEPHQEGQGRVHHEGKGGVLMALHAVVSRSLTASLQSRDSTLFSSDQARNHQARSAIVRSASRMKRDLHPDEIFWPEAYRLSCIWMLASNELLHFLYCYFQRQPGLKHGRFTMQAPRSTITLFARC